jgi:hypothetical protein
LEKVQKGNEDMKSFFTHLTVCCAYFLIGLFCFLGNVPCTVAQEVKSKDNVLPAFEKASVSFRISPNIALSEERSEQFLKLLNKYPGMTDQISFFVGAIHAPLTLEETEKRCLVLKKRMKRVREYGYESGINILCTMGFMNENMVNTVGSEFGRCTDIHGNVNHGKLCPNHENHREYVKKLYRILVEAEPDKISAYVDSYHKMNIWTRPTKEPDSMSILLLNHSYDIAEKVAVCIKTKADRITCYDRSCQPSEITVSSKDGVYRRFEIPKPIAPGICDS